MSQFEEEQEELEEEVPTQSCVVLDALRKGLELPKDIELTVKLQLVVPLDCLVDFATDRELLEYASLGTFELELLDIVVLELQGILDLDNE